MKTKIKKHKGIFIALTAVVSAAVLFTVLYYAMTVNIDGRRVSKNAKSIDLSIKRGRFSVKGSPLTQEAASNVWAILSIRYAQNASGNKYGFVKDSREGECF